MLVEDLLFAMASIEDSFCKEEVDETTLELSAADDDIPEELEINSELVVLDDDRAEETIEDKISAGVELVTTVELTELEVTIVGVGVVEVVVGVVVVVEVVEGTGVGVGVVVVVALEPELPILKVLIFDCLFHRLCNIENNIGS